MIHKEIRALLALEEPDKVAELYRYAHNVRLNNLGPKVYLRGLIELSNICAKNCFYCGIRRDNAAVSRFAMSGEEIVASAKWAFDNGYYSIVLQSGERTDGEFVAMMERVLAEIAAFSDGKMGVTLSLGEQSRETYRRWLAAGARRYLLRIETSSIRLYGQLHPADHSFMERVRCLETLRDLGYQLGTGVMIGLPGQTLDDLAEDVLFFRRIDADMIGMGPYIPHKDTPLGRSAAPGYSPEKHLELALKMIAATRIELPDVNIASTTALQALNPTGREMGLEAGANVVMPNITDTRYRSLYQLYEGKPCLDDDARQCRDCLENRVKSLGQSVAYGDPGDPLHFRRRRMRNMNA